jgi:hypothetical protein
LMARVNHHSHWYLHLFEWGLLRLIHTYR